LEFYDENSNLTWGELFYDVPIADTTVINTRIDINEAPMLLVNFDGDGDTDSESKPDVEVKPNGEIIEHAQPSEENGAMKDDVILNQHKNTPVMRNL
jgi:hypothetical protein